MALGLLDRLRRPEYTGNRRCWPCTVLNLGIVFVAAGVFGLLVPLGGLVILLAGTTLVALRGYVVPYTPRFAPRIASRLPVSFGHEPTGPRSDPLLIVEEPTRLLGVLLEAGIIVEDGDLYLDAAFEAEWLAAMAQLREQSDEEIAAAAADAAPFEATSLVSGTRLLIAGDDKRDIWLTRPVAIATAAGINVLVDRGLDRTIAASAVSPLRMFLQTCPDCGEPTEESTVHNCCGGTKGVYDHPEREVIACESCEAVLYEFPLLDEQAAPK